MIEESSTLSLTIGIALASSSQRSAVPTKTGEDRHDLNKVVNVRGPKSSARRKTQQGSEEAPSFNLWRSLRQTIEEDMSNHGLGTTPLPFTSTQ